MVIRSLIFDCFFYTGTACASMVFSPVFACSRALTLRIARVWVKSSLWLLEKVVGLTYMVEGLENLPSGPFIIASKHQSVWETLAFTALLYDPAFVLKRSLLYIPCIGWALKKLGMIAVERARKSSINSLLSQARELAAQGRPIVIFPEGTRTLPGQRVSYKKGLWVLYSNLHLPVVPVALNSGLFWSRRAWFKKPGKIRVIFGKPLESGMKEEPLFREWLKHTIDIPSQQLIGPM